MSKSYEIDCWNCGEQSTLKTRSEFDGCCWACGAEIDLEDYLAKAMDERDQSRAEAAQLKNTLLDVTTRHFASSWKRRTDDAELERYLSDGIAQLEADRDQLRAVAEANKWIPLSEATPPDGVPVLRWPGWAAEISIDEWCDDYGCFLMSIEEGERATHWKPISAPAAMAAKDCQP